MRRNLNKLFAISALTTFMVIGSCVAFSSVSNGVSAIERWDPANEDYSIELNSSKQINGDDYVLTAGGNPIYFGYTNNIKLDPAGGWVSFPEIGEAYDDRYIYNTTAIKGMKSITIDTNAENQSLEFYYGSMVDGVIVYSNYIEVRSTTHTEYDFEGHPSYFKIHCYIGQTITNLEIEYSCEEELTPTRSSILNFSLINENTEYSVTGFKSGNIGDDLIIPSTYNDKPVTAIADNAFRSQGLKTVVIPEGVRTIGEKAFYLDFTMTTLMLPSTIESIGADAFTGCAGITTMEISASTTYVSPSMFNANPYLQSITVAQGNPNYYDVNGVLYAKEYDDEYGHHGKTLLVCPAAKTGTITIPDDVTYVLKDSFKYSSATEIHIGSGVTFIGEDFYQSRSLVDFEVDSNNVAYSDVSGLLCTKNGQVLISYPRGRTTTEVGIPSGINRINDKVFKDNNNIESITFSNVSYFGESVCENMASLTTINISGASTICAAAFKKCTALESVTIPYSVTELPSEAFSGCSSLATLNLSVNLESIGSQAFKGCSSLTSLSLPSSYLESIGSEAFMDCTHLNIDLTIPYTVTSCGARSFKNTPIKSISLSDNMTSIPEEMFYNCDSLEEITIPGHILSVGTAAFSECDRVEKIHILDGVQSIGQRAFRHCGRVHYQFIPKSVTVIGGGAFEFNDVNANYYTPYSYTEYATPSGLPDGWSDIFSGHQLEYTHITGSVSRSWYNDQRATYGWGN